MATIGSYTANGGIISGDGSMAIPPDPDNADFQHFKAMEAAGDTITPYVAPPAPLPNLLPYQFRAMLALSGKQADLDAYIAGLSDPAKTIAQAKLDYSLIFERDNDLVLAAQSALGLTDDQLDALWEQAAAIS